MRLFIFIIGCLFAQSIEARSYLSLRNDTIPTTLPKDSIPVDSIPRDSLASDSIKADTVATKPKKETEYEKLVKKGGSMLEGLFTVRHIEDKYYFEIPDELIGRMFLCVTRFTAVPQGFGQFAGEEITHCAVYFEQRDSTKLLLRQYVQSHFADPDDRISRTLERATIDPIVQTFKVIGRNTDNNAQLVEVTSLFNKDNNLMSLSSNAKSQLKVNGLQGDGTFIDTIKVFPTNIEVATTRTYGSGQASSPASATGNVTMGFNTSIVILPEEPMRKRLWDDRVGYFVNNFVRFSDQQRKTQHESFISRYRLEPKDRSKYLRGELTEPVKPIVFYIDPATPAKWVPYLIQGINDWNIAFEAAGFKNAIMAFEWPANDSTMSLDDARFNVIRYLPSETENAYGPRIVDPRSGEIIEAHICWYHNVMNLLTKWYMVQCGAVDSRARSMKFPDELMGQLIRFVSSHEVGHSLGLRHNMGASFATPVEKLRDKKWVERHGHTASIMDYARFNYVAQPEDNISERGLFPRINDYDRWAIKWGYQWRPEFKDEYEEKERLMTETTKALRGNQRLWFGGEGYGSDPRSQTEDLSDNNMKASEYGILNLKRVMQNLLQWTHQDNGQYEDLQTMYRAVSDQYNRYVNHVSRNLGGVYNNNMPDMEPVEPVPAWREREAVRFMKEQVFDAPLWLYPADIISKTGTNATTDNNARQDALLERMMTPALLNIIYNASNPVKQTADETYPLPDYLSDLFDAVWQPLSGQNEWKDQARRQLERAYLSNANRLLNPSESDLRTLAGERNYNSDAILYVVQNLQRVEDYCRQQASAYPEGSINTLHFQDLLRQISLIRERRTTTKHQ